MMNDSVKEAKMMIKVESIKNRHLKRVVEHIMYLLIVLVLIPGFIYFEICIVLPKIVEQWSLQYFIHLFNAFFLILNIVGNLIYGVFTDTTIRARNVYSPDYEDWTFCSECECLRPPRAWHCDTCNICILKRDHHCVFFACCVGYYNHRYFMWFTMHVFIAMVYSFILNVKCISEFVSWSQGLAVVKFLFPLAGMVVDAGHESLYVFILIVNAIVALFTGFLFFYHMNNLLKGKITAENKHCPKYEYDRGWKNNLIEVFGCRWYLSWLSPFVRSPLPGNGIEWEANGKFK